MTVYAVQTDQEVDKKHEYVLQLQIMNLTVLWPHGTEQSPLDWIHTSEILNGISAYCFNDMPYLANCFSYTALKNNTIFVISGTKHFVLLLTFNNSPKNDHYVTIYSASCHFTTV